MLGGISSETFDKSQGMTRESFIKSAMKLKYGEEYSDEALLELARGYGVGANSDYDYAGLISYDEAVGTVINLMGYSVIYPDDAPVSIASKISILSGVEKRLLSHQ